MRNLILSSIFICTSLNLAHADPKVIILDNCSRVETSVSRNLTDSGERYTQTVKCYGDAQEPKVRDNITYFNGIALMPGK